MSTRRLYLAVAACAAIVYVGSLWNRFAFDDIYAVVLNPLVHRPSGIWEAFGNSYWAGNLNTTVYRPLAVASFALDWMVGKAAWFHAVNVLWHVAATLLVALLAHRWAGERAALVAGLVFAVHPVHVEAVANVVGRNELMAAVFALLSVYAALERGSVLWSAVALAAGLLSKENAAVVPGLIAWAWVVGLRPTPERRKLVAFVASWIVIGMSYAALRWIVFRGYGQGITAVAPVFNGQGPLTVRLTAVAGFVDIARLLLFPLHLRADYSPLERTAVTSFADGRLWGALAVFAVWAFLLGLALKRRRRLEAFGLGWVAIAYSPVANLLFPIGVYIAERTLYLPSVGLALALGGLARDVPPRRYGMALAAVVLAGGLRTALRVPVWRDTLSATMSLASDAPRSYRTYDYAGWQFLWAGQKRQALDAFLHAGDLYPRDHRVDLAAADVAFSLGRYRLADSLLARADRVCAHCLVSYHNQAGAARLRGDSASADSLLAHARRLASP